MLLSNLGTFQRLYDQEKIRQSYVPDFSESDDAEDMIVLTEAVEEQQIRAEQNEHSVEEYPDNENPPNLIWRPSEEKDGLIYSSFAPFQSLYRSAKGGFIESAISQRLIDNSDCWVTSWENDTTIPLSDEEGWIYADLFDGKNIDSFGAITKNSRYRRRRLLRKRKIGPDAASWYHEMLDCSSLLMQQSGSSCNGCEQAAIQSLEKQLQNETSRQSEYQKFLLSISESEQGSLERESISALEEEEKELEEEVKELESKCHGLMQRREEVWSTGKKFEELIHGTFREGAFLQHILSLIRDERQSVGVFSVHTSDMLRRLQRYDVCNDVFHIWHDGVLGTINGLRLGRLPSKSVEWVEINAALGHSVLLLAIIAERATIEFTRNKLIPRGSFSRVVNMYGKEYCLYSDGGMFRRRGFNQALILFLECVDDACQRAMREEPALRFPYKMSRGKIGDLPISLGNDEQWSKALKYMLTHLKWLLAWVAKQYP
uniref:Beclin1like protein putative n=1 Tax=Albugo laibachii Nc14 TaxID=890382 RepID=F0X194_9STRA|nr:beclin1like protein putative [Albugo laibachii Nc14]|eukprot:CCA27554.1 beclin1like protein putative [Albugo laibachii Nc14]